MISVDAAGMATALRPGETSVHAMADKASASHHRGCRSAIAGEYFT